jgi:hypothetical protein
MQILQHPWVLYVHTQPASSNAGAADEAVLNKLRKNQGHRLKEGKNLKVTRPAEG